ncbi:MAG: SufE family protein [Alphaproteobacteria bacterium]|nr:SufE family protein [Alphaproteobacteria bacterium]MCK5556618.1 SufE family protein [Alphaproteobacteria bacterium]MCK5658851.1 SufE family protein [Alphaproteobacteria bacterium]
MNSDELVDNFSLFEDWEDRYNYLIDLGDALPLMEDALKSEETKVKGCISQAWMVMEWDKDNKIFLLADSDSRIVKGLIAVLRILFHEKTAEEAQKIDIDKIFKKLGLDQNLTPNRRNGFYEMVEQVRSFTTEGM